MTNKLIVYSRIPSPNIPPHFPHTQPYPPVVRQPPRWTPLHRLPDAVGPRCCRSPTDPCEYDANGLQSGIANLTEDAGFHKVDENFAGKRL